MRRIDPSILPFVLLGAVLFLSLLGAATAVVSFLLLRAGYGLVVYGVLPFLALLLIAIVLCTALWLAAGGGLPIIGRRGSSGERPSDETQPGRGPRRGDDV